MNSESSNDASLSLPCYRFGPYKVDPSERRLQHNGVCVELTPKAFETLLLLLENSGRLLKKEHFMRRLWPDSTVEEANLAHYISELRRVLQERSPGEKFIETVPKLGYRFVAPVESVRPPEAPVPEPSSEAPGAGVVREVGSGPPRFAEEGFKATPRVRKPVWILPAVLMTAVTATGWWLVWSTQESKPVLVAVPFTTHPGAEFDPTFSPDGNQVAFAGSLEEKEPENADIYVKSVGSDKPLRLTFAPELDLQPSWAPDGSYIAFIRLKDDLCTIYTIPPLGGVERKVYETKRAWKSGLNGRLLACTPDSKAIVISESRSPEDPNSLFLFKLKTGEKVRLTSPPAGAIGDCDPVFSPDGRVLTFARVQAGRSVSDLYRIGLSSDLTPVAEPASLTDRMPVRLRDLVGHAWSAEGREIIASSERGFHTRDFWRIPVNDPQCSTRLELAEERGVGPVISGPSRRMIYVKEQPGIANIWYLEDSGQSEKQAVPTRLLGSTQCEGLCQVSPDGAKVAFESVRTGFSEICVSNSDGSGFLRLTDYDGPRCAFPVWSPDSRWVAYEARPEGQSEIYVISPEGGQPRRITHDPGDDVGPTFSRDGRWIYFTSNRTGAWQVWKMSTGGGDPVQVTQEGGWFTRMSVDGRTLFLGKPPPEWGVYRMPVEGGAQELFLPDGLIDLFAPAAHGYYFWRMKGSGGSVFGYPDGSLVFLDSSTGARRVVTVTDQLPTSVSPFPDGKRIMFSQMGHPTADLYLVENFR